MYCKYCGQKIDDDAKYCSQCGKRQGEVKPIISNDDKIEFIKNHKFRLAYIIYVLICFSIYLSWDYYFFHSSDPKERFAEFLNWAVIIPLCIYIVLPVVTKWTKIRKQKKIIKDETFNNPKSAEDESTSSEIRKTKYKESSLDNESPL